jgi:exosortase
MSISPSMVKSVIVSLPLACLWFRLVHNLWPEWTTNPQYGFGLLVPLLCLGLLIRRWHGVNKAEVRSSPALRSAATEGGEIGVQDSVVGGQRSVVWVFGVLAFLYLPTRLIEAATPEWRPIQWLLGIEAIGLTLCVIELGWGRGWMRQLAFPLLFFFVAIPWPSLVEQPVIQNLTRLGAAIVTEALGLLGIPAVAHGNVIEVGTGVVGIDEACSGIRSFQSSLMISFFLGEFYRLGYRGRCLLVPAGFALSMIFNVCRMLLLTMVAAKNGVAAISVYHDPAGITITILCTFGLWGLAWLLFRRQMVGQKMESANTSNAGRNRFDAAPGIPLPGRGGNEVAGQNAAVATANSAHPTLNPQLSTLNCLAFGLMVWLVAVEAGVLLWYRHLESHMKPSPSWMLSFPRQNVTLKELPIPAETAYLLRYDEGKQAEWVEVDGSQWQVFYCSWLPGRVAGYLAKRHTPEICLAATGVKMVSGPELTLMNVHGVVLPVRSYVFRTAGGLYNVYHCRWEAGVDNSTYVERESARFNLIRGIWAGRGIHGQKVFEIILTGVDDPAKARAAVARQLEELIKVEKPGPDSS